MHIILFLQQRSAEYLLLCNSCKISKVCRARMKKKKRGQVCAVSCWNHERCVWQCRPSHKAVVTADNQHSCLNSYDGIFFTTRCVCKAAFAQSVTFKNAETPRFRDQNNTGEMAAAWNGERKGSQPPPTADVWATIFFNCLWAVSPMVCKDFQRGGCVYSKHGKSKRGVFITV